MDVVALSRQGWTVGQIAVAVGRHPATVSSWLKRGGPPPRRGAPAGHVAVVDGRWAARVAVLLEANPELLATSVERVLRAEGWEGSYVTLARHLRDVRGVRRRRSGGVSVPIETAPGFEFQFDWSDCCDWGEVWGLGGLQCFGAVLSWSRRRFWWFAPSLDRPHTFEGLVRFFTRHDSEPLAESLRSFASVLRSALPAGVFPPAGPTGGYQLAGDIDNDWALFRALVADATGLPAGPERLELIDRALRLVRGVQLSRDTWLGVDQAVHQIETAIERTAADGAHLAMQLRDARTAETLLIQGLLATPTSPLLWELRLAAAAAGSGLGLQRAWALAQAALGDDSAMLAAAYERLRTGQF